MMVAETMKGAEMDAVRGAGSCARADLRVRWLSATELVGNGALATAWDALATRASEPNPFAERWYLQAAVAALGDAGVRLAVVEDATGLIGIIPLQQASHYARLPLPHMQNWLNYNAFLGLPLVREGCESEFWQALFTDLDRNHGAGMFLHLTAMPLDGPIVQAMQSVCTQQGRRHALVQQEERALLERGLSPADYLETHVRSKKRKEYRRQHKRLAEEGALTFTRSLDADGLDIWIAQFLALEHRGWKGAKGSALACTPETTQLFRAALQGAAAGGKLERLDLQLNGAPIAMLATFLTPPGAFSFKTAFDEDYARFSPGVLLQIENLALLDRKDMLWCDSCAAPDHPMIDSLWAGRRRIGRFSIAIGGTANRARFALLLAAERAKARMKGRSIA